MALIRKLLKVVGLFVGSVIALALVAFLALLIINLNDKPPSALTLQITREFAERESRSDKDNAYVFMLGFAAGPDADPAVLGIERRKWIERSDVEFDRSADPLANEVDYKARRSNAVAALAAACRDPDPECLAAFVHAPDAIAEWLTSEDWLLVRYRTLVQRTDFQEIVPTKIFAPSPNYNAIFDAQRLYLVSAWSVAGRGDTNVVREMLDSDLQFWRLALRNSELLFSKLVSTAAIIRHFKFGNLVLRSLPEQARFEAIPDSWQTPISLEERSMRRAFRGEWMFFDASIRRSIETDRITIGNWLGREENTVWERVLKSLAEPFWQLQDSSNRRAATLVRLGSLFDAPYDSIPDTIAQANRIEDSTIREYPRAYNPIGDILSAIVGNLRLYEYAVRVADLEGVRLAALLAAELRGKGVNEDDAAREIRLSRLENPYTHKPFEWRESPGSIVFIGLQPDERATHRIIY